MAWRALFDIILFRPPLIVSMINKILCRIPKVVSRRGLLDKCRTFSASVIDDHVNVVVAAGTEHRTSTMLPVTQFTEDEQMVRDAARIWANEELKPIVRDMDDECKTRPEVIQSLFEHGFMGMVRCMSCNYIVCY